MAVDDRDAAIPYKIVAAGSDGVDEMRAHINESTVQFGLVKFTFGSGSFARPKLLFIHVNPDSCSALKRGRLNTRKGDVHTALGATAAEMILTEAGECTVDNVLTELSKVITADEMGDFHIDKMKADYEAMIVASKTRRMSLRPGKRRTAAEMGSVPSHRAIEELRKPIGAFNWCLFNGIKGGELGFVNAGSGSVREMRDFLAEDQVLFGLIRMGFGTGRFRRTKYIFAHWSGEKVGAVARGRANAMKSEMSKALAPYSVEVHPNDLDEITLEEVIAKVRRAAVVDGDGTDAKDGEGAYSLEAFMEALAEEQAANAEFFGNAGEEGAATFTWKATLDDLHSHDGHLNWALVEIK